MTASIAFFAFVIFSISLIFVWAKTKRVLRHFEFFLFAIKNLLSLQRASFRISAIKHSSPEWRLNSVYDLIICTNINAKLIPRIPEVSNTTNRDDVGYTSFNKGNSNERLITRITLYIPKLRCTFENNYDYY